MGRRQLTASQWAIIDIQLSNGVKPLELAREYCIPESSMRYRREKLRKDQRNPTKKIRRLSIKDQLALTGSDERYVVLTLRLLLQTGALVEMTGERPVIQCKLEFDLKIGRIDMLLVHDDGGISIIEAKAFGTLAAMASGIGQVLLYHQALAEMLGDDQPPYVHGYLAAPVAGHSCCGLLYRTCLAGGVRLIALSSRSITREISTEIHRKGQEATHGA